MQLFKYIDRINLLDKLIRQRKTGTQSELASRLGISVSRLARIIEHLKDLGAPVAFDRSNSTYYYENEYSIQIKVDIQQLNLNQMKHISAGNYFVQTNFLNAFFVH